MKLKENLELIGAIVLICIVFFLGKSCGNKTDIKPEIRIERYTDTIYARDTVFSLKEKPVPYPVYIDTNTYKPQPIDSLELNRFFTYKDSTEDSNIKLYSDIHTQGKTLVKYKPSYKLKVPLIIKDSIVVKKDSLIFKPSKYELSGGVLFGYNTIAPTVELKIDKNTFGVAYDPFKKYPYIVYKRVLWRSEK